MITTPLAASSTADADGIRSSKTVDGVKHEYVTLDGKIIRETYGTVTVNYFYDNEGKPYKLTVDEDNSTSGGYYTGYFVLNQQGDVIAILNANGVKVVSYEYNAWGQIKEETATSTNVGTLFLEHNALKYRGYYYDAETGFYYVSSRYYDPVIGRFINADEVDTLTAGHQNFIQYNLYTYCWNNPVNMTDESGTWPNWAKVVVGAAATVAAVAVTVATGGAALPVIASVAASTVGGAVTGYIKGGKQGAIDGAANGFMMGGISALAGAAVGAIKTVGSYKKTIDTYSSLTKQYYIYQMPEKEAEQRNEYEEQIVEEYLKESVDEEKDEGISKPEYQYSDTNSYNYKGTVDSILVMDKINLKKVVIRGHQLSDNDYNLSKYYFVTQDLETTLNGNYIIFGHSLQTYGHSFNRLDEIVVTDEFYLIQEGKKFTYRVEAVDRVLRSESEPYFPDLDNRVTLVSCEKHLAKGYTQKRVIIVRAVLIKEEIF